MLSGQCLDGFGNFRPEENWQCFDFDPFDIVSYGICFSEVQSDTSRLGAIPCEASCLPQRILLGNAETLVIWKRWRSWHWRVIACLFLVYAAQEKCFCYQKISILFFVPLWCCCRLIELSVDR